MRVLPACDLEGLATTEWMDKDSAWMGRTRRHGNCFGQAEGQNGCRTEIVKKLWPAGNEEVAMAGGRSAGRQSIGHQAQPVQETGAPETLSLELIAEKLGQLTWRHRLWGVDEREAWHVIARLDEMYRQLFREQQIHYEALLEEARQGQASRQVPE